MPNSPQHTAHKDCPLCQGTGGQLVWSDAALRLIAATDAPLPGVHRLIVQDHVREFSGLTSELRHRIADLLAETEAELMALWQPDKMNLASLGNQVAHQHWHLIPRWRTDPYWPNSLWSEPLPLQRLDAGPEGLVCAIGSWAQLGQLAEPIRRMVFIQEQGVPEAEEWDGRDPAARQFVLHTTAEPHAALATARLLSCGNGEARLGRMAVAARHRRQGLARCLLAQVEAEAVRLGFSALRLHAQTQALGLYAQAGFEPEGEVFLECGMAHQAMHKPLSPATRQQPPA